MVQMRLQGLFGNAITQGMWVSCSPAVWLKTMHSILQHKQFLYFCHTYAQALSGAAVDKTLALAGSAYTMTSTHAPNFSSFPYTSFAF